MCTTPTVVGECQWASAGHHWPGLTFALWVISDATVKTAFFRELAEFTNAQFAQKLGF